MGSIQQASQAKNDDQVRRAQLAKIHVLKKELGLDDDSYRQMLQNVAGVRSAADLDANGRRRVLDAMEGRDRGHSSKGVEGRPANFGDPVRGPLYRKIEAMLYYAGRQWAYAEAIAKTMFGIPRVAWLKHEQLHKVMLALLADDRRHGRNQVKP
jgi:phage gp16-like protein